MKEVIKFQRLYFNNRWKQHHFSRNCDWTIIGFSKFWSGPQSFCYKICLFGLELHFWYSRNFI